MIANRNFDIDQKCKEILELLAKKHYRELKNEFSEMEPVDIAEIFECIPLENLIVAFRLLPKDMAAEVFVEMSTEGERSLIDRFSDREISDMLDELYYDDTVDIIEEMPANVVQRILKNARPEMRRAVNDLLKYPDNSAGSIMTTEYVSLNMDMNVKEAFDHIRSVAIEKETVYTCYVLSKRVLYGVVSVKDMLIANLDTPIKSIMETSAVSVSAYADREEAAQLFSRYGFPALPVVDKEERMVGIITFDDVMDVIREETEEDFAKMAAITPGDKPYIKTSVFGIWKKRIPWLLLMMVSATFTSMIIGSFESALSAQILLTSFIPMLMGTGGNSGSQASVTVIRGISVGEIGFSDLPRVLWKEFRVSILCGVSLSVATFFKIMLFDNLIMNSDVSVAIAAVVCATMSLTVICAKLIGCALPMAAKKIGFDPAVMASPFIATIVDAVSLLIYFAMASAILGI